MWLGTLARLIVRYDHINGDAMHEAVMVSAARTGIGKAFRGALNNTRGGA